MKIATSGPTGTIGHGILNNDVSHGHEVIAIARNPQSAGQPELRTPTADILDLDSEAKVMAWQDVVISAFGSIGGAPHQLVDRSRCLLAALRRLTDKKLLFARF